MDYPDVTNVVQVGLPSNKEQYIHRLGKDILLCIVLLSHDYLSKSGRTARAGKGGAGVLLLADFETFFLKSLKDTPIVKSTAFNDEWDSFAIPVEVTRVRIIHLRLLSHSQTIYRLSHKYRMVGS